MTIRTRSAWSIAVIALALTAVAPARGDVLVNINAAHYGYQESPIIPGPGQSATPINESPNGALNQLILTAGTYMVTNAAGQFGADFDAFKFNQAADGLSWTWNFLITNASNGNQTVLFGNGSDVAATQADAASNAAGYVGYFTLTSNAKLNFMVRDNVVGDNTGGVSLRITHLAPLNPVAVPEPAAFVMLAAGAILPAAALARRRLRGA